MAAYAATVASQLRRAFKTDHITGIGTFHGTVDITNYNSTLVEIADITGQFGTILNVVAGVSDNGFLVQWNPTAKSFKAYGSGDLAKAALVQLDDDVDVGKVEFIAYGLV